MGFPSNTPSFPHRPSGLSPCKGAHYAEVGSTVSMSKKCKIRPRCEKIDDETTHWRKSKKEPLTPNGESKIGFILPIRGEESDRDPPARPMRCSLGNRAHLARKEFRVQP
jgi:hypothetical protein